MKKVILTLLMLITNVAIFAQEISEDQARQTAAGFIASKAQSGGIRKAPASAASLQLAWAPTFKSDAPEVYVYNMPADGGFVIVSGDAGTSRQVLGWSDHGSFDPANMPPGLRFLSAQYVVDIATLRQEDASTGNLRSKLRRAQTSGFGEVLPLLKTKWSQWAGYNDMLPEYPTGCVATAMAQIMNYHQWPKHGYGRHTNSYMIEKGVDQTVDFSQSVYDWEGMANNDAAAISKLMYDFGCATNMQYGTAESAANDFDALKALVTNFGYDESAIKQAGRSEETLRNELLAGRPVYYAGQDTISKIVWIDGTHWYKDFVSDGHAFVCDGFSDDGLFHFNIGWGGQGDGYYTLDVIRPNGDDDLTHSYGPIGYLVYGIQPGEKVCVDGVWYSLNEEDCTATLGSGGYEGDVTIPEQFTYNGTTYTVNAMYPYAFAERRYDKNLITNLTFNAAIEEFPARFIRCGEDPGHVENVTFGGGVRRIADEAFRNIEELLTATFGDNVESIGKDAFNGCKWLSTINLGNSITEISDGAFRGCSIMDLDVPANVKRIGKYAVRGLFYRVKFNGPVELDTCAIGAYDRIYNLQGLEHCSRIAYHGLQGVSLETFTPNPAAKYDSYALSGKIDKIIIPAECTDYDYTTALETREFYVDPANPNLASSGGALYTKDMKTLLAQPLLEEDGSYASSRYVPMGVTQITEQPIAYNYQYLYLPPTIQHINSSSICMYNVHHIYCMAPTPPTFDEDKQGDIQINAKLHVPAGTEEAYASAPVWSKFSRIESDMHSDGRYIYLHEDGNDFASVIGRNPEAFTGHDFVVPSLTEINGEKLRVTWIEPSVFQGDHTVESVTLGAFIESVDAAFKNCSNLKRVKIEGDIYALSTSAFENCTSLVKVEIPRTNHLTNLGNNVFANCSSLESIDLTSMSDEFMNFGKSVFEGCTSLRTVKGISDHYRLPGRTFANSGIETFHIGRGMNVFDYDNPFEGCSRLHSFTVAPDHDNFYVADGILYKRNEYSSYPWSLYVCPPLEVKDGQLGERTVINISERCNQLNTQMPASAKEVVIPSTMGWISSGTFSYTTNLETLTVLRDDPDFVDDNTFWAVYTKATLQVPPGRKNVYAEHREWGKFTNIVEVNPDDYPSPEAIKAAQEALLNAEDDPTIGNALVIFMQDDDTHFLHLAKQPVITITSNQELQITGDDISLLLPISYIKYYSFDTYILDSTGMETIADDNQVNLYFDDDSLRIKGQKSGRHVQLYDLQGRLIRDARVDADGTLSMSLRDLPTAVYVLKVNDTTYKIMK